MSSAPLTPPGERPPPPSFSPVAPPTKSRLAGRVQSMIKPKYGKSESVVKPHLSPVEHDMRQHVSEAKKSECEQVALALKESVTDVTFPPPPNSAEKKAY